MPPAAVQHEPAFGVGPRDEQRSRNWDPPVQHPYGRRVQRQAVQKVGRAVQRVQRPDKVRGPRLRLRVVRPFLAKDAVAGEPPDDLRRQELLAGLVHGRHRVPLRFVFVLDGYAAAEVTQQYLPGSPGHLLRGAGYLARQYVVDGSQGVVGHAPTVQRCSLSRCQSTASSYPAAANRSDSGGRLHSSSAPAMAAARSGLARHAS